MLAEQQQHNLLGHSPSLTFGNLASAFPGSFANFDGQYVILPDSKMNGKDAKVSENNLLLSVLNLGQV